jgi:hypothetical protein
MVAVILSIGGSAFGQFIVSPMRVDIQTEPGKVVGRELTIENTTDRAIDQVDLVISDLSQSENGAWTPIERGDPNVDWSKIQSSAKWMVLDKQSIQLAPKQKSTFNVQVRVPTRTQGVYSAAIIAKATFPPGTVAGYQTAVAIQYVMPVLVEVQGRILRNEVELSSIGLAYKEPTSNTSAASLTTLALHNKGGTYCRVQGYVRLSGKWGGHWRRITESQFTDIGIIPGSKLLLARDIGRPLMAGQYKLEGFLVVNGDNADQIEKVVEFKGDPRAAPLKSDAALDFDPQNLVVDAIPGSLRASRIQVVNASEEPVNVNVSLTLPEHLGQLVQPDPCNPGRRILGEDYGCARWVTIEPNQFSLAGYGRQALSVKVNLPETATSLPNYYAVVNLKATYPGDKQMAGTARGMLCVQVRKMTGTAMLEVTGFNVSELSPTKFQMMGRVVNKGTTHTVPTCRAVLASSLADGGRVVRTFSMSGESYNQSGNLLPLETRTLSGVLDISGVAAGDYLLIMVAESENHTISQLQRGFIITESNGVKSARIAGTSDVGGEIKRNF